MLMLHRRITQVVIILAVCGFLAWWNPASLFAPLRSGLWTVSEPFVFMFRSVRINVGSAGKFLSSFGTLKQENEALENDVTRLQARVAELEDMERENARLRMEIDLLPRGGYETTAALVVSGNSDGVSDWLVINKGSRDGIREDFPVTEASGVLVGSVDEVYFSTARVRLITHPESVVNVRTTETEAKGVVRGEFGLGLLFDMALQTDTLKSGDRVVTSVIGTAFPAGLYVGDIGDVQVSEDGLFQRAQIISPLDFSDLFLVSVIRQH